MNLKARYALLIGMILPLAGCNSSDMPTVPPPPPAGTVPATPPPAVVPKDFKPRARQPMPGANSPN